MSEDVQKQTTDDRQICDYPVCSVRGSGHPLACNCRSGIAPPQPAVRHDAPNQTTPARRLWTELAAMVARARHQENWHLMLNGHAQDLEQAEAALRDTKAEVMT